MVLPALPGAASAAKRYLTNNPRFALKIAGQLAGLKKYPLE